MGTCWLTSALRAGHVGAREIRQADAAEPEPLTMNGVQKGKRQRRALFTFFRFAFITTISF